MFVSSSTLLTVAISYGILPTMAWIKYPTRKPLTLSPRQQEVLVGWWIGESIKQTSDRMGVTEATVKKYRETARLKLNAPSILVAVKRALRRRLLPARSGPGPVRREFL